MPFIYANQDQIEDRVTELERSGQRVVQILKVGDRWAIVTQRGPGRPPKETRDAT